MATVVTRADDTMRSGSPLFVLLLTITLLSSTCLEASTVPSVGRPVVNVTGDEMIVNPANGSVSLRCHGDLTVTWNITQGQSGSGNNRMTVTNRLAGNSSVYESILELKDLTYADTGYYRCIYPSHSDPNLTATVYIYVYDGKHLLVDSETKYMVVFHNRAVTIPSCRSTHPSVKVILKERDGDQMYKNYDPRIGITIKKVTDKLDGEFICQAKYLSVTRNSIINFKYRGPTVTPRVTLSLLSGHSRMVLTGETVVYACSAQVTHDATVWLNWSYPAKNSATSGRIQEIDANRTDQGETVFAKLVVHNFTLNDSGTYRCQVTDHNLKHGTAELQFTAYEKSFITLTAENMTVEAQQNTQTFVLSVDVEAYPKPHLSWFRDGKLITSSPENSKYSDSSTSHLKIHNVNPLDKGKYTLRASNRDANASLDITLNVAYPPTVRITRPIIEPTLHTTGDSYDLECRPEGFPKPEVVWLWKECTSANCIPAGEGDWVPANQTENQVVSSDENSIMRTIARESGWFKCSASNKMGNSSAVSSFFVTDVKDGFGIKTDQSGPIHVGDDVNVSCIFSRFLNLSELYWTQTDAPLNQEDSEKLTTNDENIETRTTNFSQPIVITTQDAFHTISTLMFTGVEMENSGSYVCVAQGYNGKQQNKTWDLVMYRAPISEHSRMMSSVVPQHQQSHLTVIIGISTILGALVFSLIAVIVYLFRRPSNKFSAIHLESLLQSSTTSKYNPDLPLDEQTDVLSYDTQWEISRDQLKFDVVIGKGAFGTVYRATAFGLNGSESVMTVAVKTVKDSGKMEQLKALISELKVLLHLGQHVNILNALGAVTTDIKKGSLYVVMEYCHYGCLRDYLVKQRYHVIAALNNSFRASVWVSDPEELPSDDVDYLKATDSSPPKGNVVTTLYGQEMMLTSKDLVCYAFQIARGLEYLHSKKYIHRDLAARNVLLSAGNVVKICDFGLAKDCYKYSEYRKKSSTPVPIKWMALESLTHNVYTTKSDIWSYGIVLWELFTVGGQPYPTLKMDKSFIDMLNAGHRLEKPLLAEELVYQLMLCCWEREPEARPHASELVEIFGGMLEATVKQHYIDLKVHSIDYLQMNTKSGCLENVTNPTNNIDNAQPNRNSRPTRIPLTSFESGFASISRPDEDANHFEYLPPSVVEGSGDSSATFDPTMTFGPSRQNPEYQNDGLTRYCDVGNGCYHLRQHNDSVGNCSLSSGVSDSVFFEQEPCTPPPQYHNVITPLLTASV